MDKFKGKNDVKITIKRDKQPKVNKLNYMKSTSANTSSPNRWTKKTVNKSIINTKSNKPHNKAIQKSNINKSANKSNQNRKSNKPVNKPPRELVRKLFQGKHISSTRKTKQNTLTKPNGSISHPNIKIACILDAIPMDWFKYECTLLPLDSKNWYNQIVKENPNMLLVQSTWADYKGDWRYSMINLKHSSNNNLVKLLRFCKMKKIPTAFWNIEDPYDFNTFIGIAKYFDYVFTTDSGSIKNYNNVLKHKRVYALPFAAQPIIHNPINKDIMQNRNIGFAGSWYHIGHNDRKKDMENILKPALKYNVDIYDRMYSLTKNNSFKFPNIYQKYIKGYLPYCQMSSAYKKYRVFLNVNTVQNSPTMFSCRIFELLASGVNVVSGYSLGIQKMFPKIVRMSKSQTQTNKHLTELLQNKTLRDRLSIQGQREVFSKHTYRHRIETIFHKVGIKYKKTYKPGVTIITTCLHDSKIEKVFKNYRNQKYIKKELIVVLNKNNMNIELWKKEAKKYPNVRVLKLNEINTLGTCFNYAVDRAKYNYIAKFDDNSYYCSNYLVDTMHAFKYTNADIIGKTSFYAYLEKSNTLILCVPNKENRFANEVNSSTIVCKKKVIKNVSFPKKNNIATSSEFIKACIKKGYKIYSSDRFNFTLRTSSSIDGKILKISNDLLIKSFTKITKTDDYSSIVTV